MCLYTFNSAAAAAKSLQSCPTLCDPIDSSPPGSPIPGILQARTLGLVAISFSNAWNEKWKWSRSVVSDSSRPPGLQPTRLLCPWDFPGKNIEVGRHARPPGDLDPRMESIYPASPVLQMNSLLLSHPGKPQIVYAAAAAKSLQSCPTLYDPMDGSPSGSTIPGILQARTLGQVAISFSSAWKWKVKVKSLSRVRLLTTPWTAAYQAPPPMGFSRQEYWSGVPLI